MRISKTYFLSLLMLTFLAGNALADDTETGCHELGEMSKSVMLARQAGVPISKVLDTAKRNSPDPVVLQLLKAIIIEAYEKPRFDTEAIKERVISEFGNSVEVACLKSSLK